MPSPYSLIVEVVQVGELPRGVCLERLMRLLSRQQQVHFRLRKEPIDPGGLQQPASGFFFTENEIMPALSPSNDAHLVLGITSLRIAPSAGALDPGNEHFGVWHNTQAPMPPEHSRKGVVSVTRWRERYEGRAFRSTEQYLAFMALAFIGDVQLGSLTHPWCTGCVFDYNPDDESIVSSVKAAALCQQCRRRIRSIEPQLEEAYLAILRGIGRPPVQAVLRYLQANGLASVFLFSGLLTLSVGLMQTLFPDAAHIALVISLLCGTIFLGVVMYYRRFPSGDLR